jgi:mRNA-degrading endonuclease RelE of RelBE toxin-antitoxin system
LAIYDIEYSAEAEEDIQYFKKYEQRIILTGIEEQLHYQPTLVTTNRFRREPPDIGEWELRIGSFRVYYTVDANVYIVHVERIGEKPNNEIYFRGKRSGQS